MFKERIAEAISKKTGIKKEDIAREIESNSKFSDLSLPCFFLSSRLKKNPAEIADELSKLKFSEEIEKAESRGAYLNFFINKSILNERVIEEILEKRESYGKSHKKGRKVMIEYSQPNPNKPMHLGHLKNDSISMAVSNILEFSGNKVIKANLWNDRGIPISKVIYAYKKLGNKKKPDKKSDHFVGDLYVLYSKKADEKSESEVLDILKRRGSITIDEIAEGFHIEKELVEEWAKILEEHKLVVVNYPVIGKAFLVLAKEGE